MNEHKDYYRFEVPLALLGGLIGYISTFAGGTALLVVAGVVFASVIGLKSESPIRALSFGAFFGVVMVTASSQLVQGYSGSFQEDVLTAIFIPYFRGVLIAALASGAVAFMAHSFVYRKSR